MSPLKILSETFRTAYRETLVSTEVQPLELGSRWYLKSGSDTLGTVTLSGIDQPWFRCEFSPATPWENFRLLFERQAAAVDSGTDDEVSAALKDIFDLNLELLPVTEGQRVKPTILQIRGSSAIFRY